MGRGQSKSVLSKPWREINWRDKQSTLQYVKDYRPQTEGQQLRILLLGPVGAGKSSFINSVQSVLYGRMYTQALVDNISCASFTKKYTTYKIQKGGPESICPFVFNDIMGLETNKGVLVDDIKLALRGHVKEGYEFNTQSKLLEGDRFYNRSPTARDKVHVLVCVVPANKVSQLTDETVQKIREIRMEASELGISQVAVLTKIDEACPEIKQDLKNVYKAVYLKEKMEEFSAEVGIPMNCIFPVKNYHEEINLDSDVDSLILSTLTNIINYGEDCISFNKSHREELLNIRQSSGQTFSLLFTELQSFTELLDGAAAGLYGICRRRRWGKLVKLRQLQFCTPLPPVHLANVRSLANKMDELLILNRANLDFCRSAALCFTETWLGEHIPDATLQLPGFQLLRADRVMELSGKKRGGGICFYINEGWCKDVTVLMKSCSPHLETIFIDCKPFYSPQEFSSFLLVGVYIPPQACVREALHHLADQITDMELEHPDSLLIVLGDFNRANLSHELPKYKQHIKCPTRGKNTLDHCYTVMKDAYHSVPHAALGLSDHRLVHLLPTYRPELNTLKTWTKEAVDT